MQKDVLKDLVLEKIQRKIDALEALIDETRASNNDTKSSMGDKYETGREMLQQEINQQQKQLNEALTAFEIVKKINTNESSKVIVGALVQVDAAYFYVCVSAGEIEFNGKKIHTVSLDSPLVKAMMGKSTGENFILNTQNKTITAVF
jgi:transcription elongation GreA/GreB family factor